MTYPLKISPSWVFGIPLSPVTYSEALGIVDSLIELGKPSYFVTANLNFAMLASKDEHLQEIARQAAFVTADGFTLVWVSRLLGCPVPERVTGVDLVYGMCALAAQREYGIFLLGAAPGVAVAAARRLGERYPGLRVVGIESPPFRELTAEENGKLVYQIRSTGAKILLVAFGQPKGERWVFDNYQKLGVPVTVQIGATLDFAAGRVPRAPKWMQRLNLETPFRILCEPRRLGPRYFWNAVFFIKQLTLLAFLRSNRTTDPNR